MDVGETMGMWIIVIVLGVSFILGLGSMSWLTELDKRVKKLEGEAPRRGLTSEDTN